MNHKKASEYQCNICGNTRTFSEEETLIIDHVPENTFNFSDKTIDLRVVSCTHCGCVQLTDVPLSPDYDVVYRSIGVSQNYREEKKTQIKELMVEYGLSQARILEVGCGDGQFLDIFKEIGVRNIVGLETGAENCRQCSHKGFEVIEGDIISFVRHEVNKDSFDAFVTFHYLEHMPDPTGFTAALYTVLKPGGTGIIEVPNYDYIERNNIWLEFTKDHRFYFRKRTLTYLLSKCGFDIEKIEENNGGICLSAIVRKPEAHDYTFSSMKDQIHRDIKEFKGLIDRLGGSFAVYGAGHYSQLLINMVHSRYGIKPRYIFDSNRQKCGNKICEVLVQHRDDTANMQDCENVVVICGLYNDEVCRMLSGLKKNIVPWR